MITRLYRLYKDFRGDILAVPGRAIAFFFILSLILIPTITKNPYILSILIFTNIFAIFAASWDLLSGFAGQVNLGHAAFFGIGAYTAALLNLKFGLPPWVTVPIGALIAVLMGLVIGFPALRIRGIYFALATLAFPIILSAIVLAVPNLTGGEVGVWGLAPLSGSRVFNYYLVLFLMIGSALILWKLTDVKSKIIRTGVVLRGIREDEITARASGINTTKYKLLVFSLSAFFAGFAGGLYAHAIGVVGPSTLDLTFTLQPVIWTIFGGIGTISGPIAGVYTLYLLMEILRVIPELRMLVFALVIILVLFFMPEGLTTWVRDKILEEECPRCKVVNLKTRHYCRACTTPLRLEQR